VLFEVEVGSAAVCGPTGDGRMEIRGSGAASGSRLAILSGLALEIELGDAAVWGPTGEGRMEIRGSAAASGSRLAILSDLAVADALLLFVVFGVVFGGRETDSGPTGAHLMEMKGSGSASASRLTMLVVVAEDLRCFVVLVAGGGVVAGGVELGAVTGPTGKP